MCEVGGFFFCILRALPCRVNPRRFCLVESRRFISLVEADDQRADSEGSHTSTLCISLLHAGHVFGDVFDRHGVFDRQAVTLCFQACLVDQYAGVSVQTGEGQADVCVDESDLGWCDPCVLQFHGGTLLAAQNDDVGAFDPHGAGAAFDGFEGIFDLEDVAVGTRGVRLLVKRILELRGRGCSYLKTIGIVRRECKTEEDCTDLRARDRRNPYFEMESIVSRARYCKGGSEVRSTG